jgi:hypothetical protein
MSLWLLGFKAEDLEDGSLPETSNLNVVLKWIDRSQLHLHGKFRNASRRPRLRK